LTKNKESSERGPVYSLAGQLPIRLRKPKYSPAPRKVTYKEKRLIAIYLGQYSIVLSAERVKKEGYGEQRRGGTLR